MAKDPLDRRSASRLWQCAEFAAKAVVALKNSSEDIAADLGLPHKRKDWEDEHWEAYSSAT
ncbi:hypothetical protein [Oscillatoria sp. FACHB-1407]|uniref:hypothetical protein n=1 Tax=Oscillatoria sp. FACHB-1407 TaxID=2692847 RepID=UPI001F559CA4|nr:hypothetical protein [Oscillatoria sp. FACHB-1407]